MQVRVQFCKPAATPHPQSLKPELTHYPKTLNQVTWAVLYLNKLSVPKKKAKKSYKNVTVRYLLRRKQQSLWLVDEQSGAISS